jgi:predicted dehydrogenase
MMTADRNRDNISVFPRSKGATMADPLRVGIIGVGWGALVHAPAFRAVDGFELVALCGRRPEPLAAAAERLEMTDTSRDWESFVRRDDLDLIAVTTPVQLHHSMFLAALEAGKHVLCEKPLCLTNAEGAEMVAAAESTDLATAVCFENRWSPERLAIADFIRSGGIGETYFVHAAQTADYWHPTHGPQSPWMYRLDEGGGYLMGMAAHDIDFLQQLFGRVVSVAADVRTSVTRRTMADGAEIDVDADDTSALLMRTEQGTLITLTTSVAGYKSASRLFQVLGSDGTIEMGTIQGQGAAVVARVGEDAPVPLEPVSRDLESGVELPARRSSIAVRAQALMLEDWRPAFEGKAAPNATIRDGYNVQLVIDAARRSSAGEGWVDIGI